MTETPPWAGVHATPDFNAARTLATSLAAMEFDVRVVDMSSGREVENLGALKRGGCCGGGGCPPTQQEVRSLTGNGPWAVLVPSADAPAVTPVVPELLEEQGAFDESLDARSSAPRSRVERFVPLVLVATVLGMVLLFMRG